jgi:hypothetical protein
VAGGEEGDEEYTQLLLLAAAGSGRGHFLSGTIVCYRSRSNVYRTGRKPV